MWNKKQSELFLAPTLSRKFILQRSVLKLMGSLYRKRLLEVGCGSGYWTRIFQKHGAICTGIDMSKEQIELAKSRNDRGIVYFAGDAAKLRLKEKFDIIFIDHVIAETHSREKAVRILKQAHSFLRKGGFVVLNDIHPSVAHFPFGNMHTMRNYFYFQSGVPITFRVKQANGKYIRIRDYHWTLQDISWFFKKAHFVIDEILEPRAVKANRVDNYLKLRHRYPSHLTIKAVPR